MSSHEFLPGRVPAVRRALQTCLGLGERPKIIPGRWAQSGGLKGKLTQSPSNCPPSTKSCCLVEMVGRAKLVFSGDWRESLCLCGAVDPG